MAVPTYDVLRRVVKVRVPPIYDPQWAASERSARGSGTAAMVNSRRSTAALYQSARADPLKGGYTG